MRVFVSMPAWHDSQAMSVVVCSLCEKTTSPGSVLACCALNTSPSKSVVMRFSGALSASISSWQVMH